MGITGKTEQKTKKRQVEIYGNIFFNLLLWLISMSFRVLIKSKVFWQKYCCWALWIFWYSMMKIINIGTDSLFKIVDGICKLFCNIKLVFFLHRRYRSIAYQKFVRLVFGVLGKNTEYQYHHVLWLQSVGSFQLKQENHLKGSIILMKQSNDEWCQLS